MTRPPPEYPEGGGILLVDKRSGPTSHDVVGRCRGLLRTRKVGHAGTLDPMATGLLVIAVDRCTKLLGHLALTDKTYTATIRLGITTDTDDAQGSSIAVADPGVVPAVTEQAILAAIAALTGTIQQRPNSVSAIKVDGRRAYDRHRAGEEFELPAREVTVRRFELTGPERRLEAPDGRGGTVQVIDLPVEVECTTGTYVRALARDLGAALGTGGHLTALRRTAVGPFSVDGALDVGGRGEDIDEPAATAAAAAVIPGATAAGLAFVRRIASGQEALDLSFGRSLTLTGEPGPVAVVDAAERILLALVQDAGDRAKPLVVFAAR